MHQKGILHHPLLEILERFSKRECYLCGHQLASLMEMNEFDQLQAKLTLCNKMMEALSAIFCRLDWKNGDEGERYLKGLMGRCLSKSRECMDKAIAVQGLLGEKVAHSDPQRSFLPSPARAMREAGDGLEVFEEKKATYLFMQKELTYMHGLLKDTEAGKEIEFEIGITRILRVAAIRAGEAAGKLEEEICALKIKSKNQ